MKTFAAGLMVAGIVLAAAPLAAQSASTPGVRADAVELPEDTVFDGDHLTVGVGVGYSASYSGSDDYRSFVLPIVQGSLAGIDISPRPAGVALDFIPDPDEGVAFSLGPVIKLNRDRADLDGIKDPVVEAYGELDTAIEVGPSAGVSFPQLLSPFDSLSFSVDAAWDVAGAHDGMSVSPSITYFTPLSRAIAVSLSLSTKYIDDDYADYYYSVPVANAALPAADVLPGFEADGGFESAGVNVLLAFDLNGDVTDGGLALIGLGGYSRMLGDAKDSPFTSIRGEADQFLGAVGIGYTF